MENQNISNDFISSDKKSAKILALINIITIPLVCITFFKSHDKVLESSIMTFLLAALLGIVNLILMILYIAKKKSLTYKVCLIFMILIPIIGLGGCQFAFSTTSVH